jgi:hypothetical protein
MLCANACTHVCINICACALTGTHKSNKEAACTAHYRMPCRAIALHQSVAVITRLEEANGIVHAELQSHGREHLHVRMYVSTCTNDVMYAQE